MKGFAGFFFVLIPCGFTFSTFVSLQGVKDMHKTIPGTSKTYSSGEPCIEGSDLKFLAWVAQMAI
jgi:hypothetical protein